MVSSLHIWSVRKSLHPLPILLFWATTNAHLCISLEWEAWIHQIALNTPTVSKSSRLFWFVGSQQSELMSSGQREFLFYRHCCPSCPLIEQCPEEQSLNCRLNLLSWRTFFGNAESLVGCPVHHRQTSSCRTCHAAVFYNYGWLKKGRFRRWLGGYCFLV